MRTPDYFVGSLVLYASALQALYVDSRVELIIYGMILPSIMLILTSSCDILSVVVTTVASTYHYGHPSLLHMSAFFAASLFGVYRSSKMLQREGSIDLFENLSSETRIFIQKYFRIVVTGALIFDLSSNSPFRSLTHLSILVDFYFEGWRRSLFLIICNVLTLNIDTMSALIYFTFLSPSTLWNIRSGYLQIYEAGFSKFAESCRFAFSTGIDLVKEEYKKWQSPNLIVSGSERRLRISHTGAQYQFIIPSVPGLFEVHFSTSEAITAKIDWLSFSLREDLARKSQQLLTKPFCMYLRGRTSYIHFRTSDYPHLRSVVIRSDENHQFAYQFQLIDGVFDLERYIDLYHLEKESEIDPPLDVPDDE